MRRVRVKAATTLPGHQHTPAKALVGVYYDTDHGHYSYPWLAAVNPHSRPGTMLHQRFTEPYPACLAADG